MAKDLKMGQMQSKRLKDAGLFPKVVLIDTTSFCNLKCSMCIHREMKRKKGIMPWDIFTKIIDEIKEEDRNIKVWMVFFGEALLLKKRKPGIFDMIRYAKDKGLTNVVLNSNANLMDEAASRNLIESGIDAVYIGIDAFNPETYNKIRVGGDYDRVVENTLALLKLKNIVHSDKPAVFVQFVEMDANRAEKKAFIDFWKRKGAVVKIRPKVSWAGLVDAPNLLLEDKDRWPCHWAMQTMSIVDSGKVVTCAVDLDARFIAGDVNRSSLKDIWNGRLKELRTLHLAGEFDKLPEHCRNCRDWQSARADFYPPA